MKDNRLFMKVVAIVLIAVSCFTMGFIVGRNHERENSTGRIIAPFVDIEYNISK